MRRLVIIAAVAAQVLVLAIMAGQREWVVRTGERVLVRTAPIDPNDPMRGEYARLNYEISTVPRSLCRDGVAEWFGDAAAYSREFRDRRVYALLELDESGVASLTALTDRRPASGLFLRGRTEWIGSRFVRVRYGIEALFMEQGRALEFERMAGSVMVGVPVNAEIAGGSDGLAVLRDYSWEPLGIQVELVRREAGTVRAATGGDAATRPGVSGAIVTLKNHGTAPLAIVDAPGGRSFRLIAADGMDESQYEPVGGYEPPRPGPRDVILLQPGDSHRTTLDFSAPSWHVRKVARAGESEVAEAVALESLGQAWGAWFRIEYVPPGRAEVAGLPHAESIRHARLRSRRFSPAGGVD